MFCMLSQDRYEYMVRSSTQRHDRYEYTVRSSTSHQGRTSEVPIRYVIVLLRVRLSCTIAEVP